MANHFAAVLPVLREQAGLSDAVLDAVFGVYAVGLLPGLLGGGALSDRIGRARVVLPGAVIAVVGTVSLLAWHDEYGLAVGRFVVGVGAGLAMGAGTAWCADLRGARGTMLAGVLLTTGFGCGPLVAGLLAQFAPAPLEVPFVVAAILGAASAALAMRWAAPVSRHRDAVVSVDATGSPWRPLGWALPSSLFVFSCVTVAFVTLPARLPERYGGPLLPGAAAALALGSGLVVQLLARRFGVGPQAGSIGAGLAAAGFGCAALGGAEPPVWLVLPTGVILGAAYGLCLRAGLLDIEELSPTHLRGALTGVYYVGTFLGFAVPLLLVALERSAGYLWPLAVLALLAALAGGSRAWRIARGGYPT
ncbi:MAG: MFS transporter [Aldersonia sp.]|nr:MFS transporter [Aldersonia sp.]